MGGEWLEHLVLGTIDEANSHVSVSEIRVALLIHHAFQERFMGLRIALMSSYITVMTCIHK